MKPLALLLVLLAATALAGAPPAQAEAHGTDPATDALATTVREGGVLEVDGLVVETGTRLVLRGVDVVVGRSVLVEAGAALRLEPLGDTPTRLRPQNESAGFWVLVEGHVESEGLPMTEVRGVNGDVLDAAAYYMPGSFRINGTAVLRDLLFRDSTAGFLVTPTGDLVLERAHLDNLTFMALATLGRTEVAESLFTNTSISISGRGSCDVTVRDTTMASWGGTTGTVLLGHGPYRFEDVHFEGFTSTGLRGDGSAHIWVGNSSFVAGPDARNAIALKPDHDITLLNVTAAGGSRHVVEIQRSTVRVEGGRYVGSPGYGIQLVESEWTSSLDEVQRIDFGLGTADANGMGPLNIRKIVYAQALNDEGLPVRGLEVEVRDRSTGDVVYQTQGPSQGASVMMDLPVLREEDGVLVTAGPFDYTVAHAAAKTQRGTLADDQRLLQVQLDETGPSGWFASLRVSVLLAALGLLLFAYALFDKPIKRWLRGGGRNTDAAGATAAEAGGAAGGAAGSTVGGAAGEGQDEALGGGTRGGAAGGAGGDAAPAGGAGDGGPA